MFQNRQCIKCKERNCISLPDKYGFISCLFCGSTQETIQGPIEIPEGYYKDKYGYMFKEDYIDNECWIDDDDNDTPIYEWFRGK